MPERLRCTGCRGTIVPGDCGKINPMEQIARPGSLFLVRCGPCAFRRTEGRSRQIGQGASDADTAPARWALFHSNRAAWAAVEAMLEAARESIAIEQFIFSHRGIGREILAILTAKARQGVHVRLLADWFGSRHLADSDGARALIAAGGEVVIFNGPGGFYRSPASAFHRLHRKSIVTDGRQLMTGGSCFHPRMEDWRDTMVLIEHPVAQEALAAFEATWRRATTGAALPLAAEPAGRPGCGSTGRTW